jgi:hypothetical protein
MKIKLALLTLALTGSAAFASDAAQRAALDIIPLKDGGILYIFSDGKMAKEDRFGRAAFVRVGEVLLSATDKQLPVTSNEVARLNYLLNKNHNN